eukprot:CAMPEP_0118955774 /NCGR_PEP_ID=MMETSP1169-20130426/60478_1 /TAXON_ID=36882 /ORGANISM="Pyramimonas obovata, Strain CCMP722" /LENGTH=242 /DNA_ID=CAMNT_0006903677 /DNA_START=180 /DNA_END=909 /DNA_ORIENTATION=+
MTSSRRTGEGKLLDAALILMAICMLKLEPLFDGGDEVGPAGGAEGRSAGQQLRLRLSPEGDAQHLRPSVGRHLHVQHGVPHHDGALRCTARLLQNLQQHLGVWLGGSQVRCPRGTKEFAEAVRAELVVESAATLTRGNSQHGACAMQALDPLPRSIEHLDFVFPAAEDIPVCLVDSSVLLGRNSRAVFVNGKVYTHPDASSDLFLRWHGIRQVLCYRPGPAIDHVRDAIDHCAVPIEYNDFV